MTEPVYQVSAVNLGGRRGGQSTTVDGGSMSVETTSNQREGTTNPEELLALGWSACFNQGLTRIKKEAGVENTSKVQVTVNLFDNPSGGFILGSVIKVAIRDLGFEQVEDLAKQANKSCAYSKAMKGNIDIQLEIVDFDSLQDA